MQSQCHELLSDFSFSTLNVVAIRSCLSGWFFKSTTSFHGYDDRVLGGPIFGLLCWSYTIAGILSLYIKPNWTKNSCFPCTLFAMILIFLQGPLSFQADYMNMANDSIFHVIDRFVAVTNLFFYAWKVATYFWNARTSIFLGQAFVLVLSLSCFLNSQKAQIMHNTSGFCLWHSLWHVSFLLNNSIDFIEVYFFEKRDGSNVGTKPEKGSLGLEKMLFWMKFPAVNRYNENYGKCHKN